MTLTVDTEKIMALVTYVSLLAMVLNVLRSRLCFILWVGTDLCWFAYDFSKGEYNEAALWLAYLGMAMWGCWAWRKKRKQ